MFTELIPFYKKLPLALDCRHSNYSLQIYNLHIFSILGMAFMVPLLCFVTFKSSSYLWQKEKKKKRKRNNFCNTVLLLISFEIIFAALCFYELKKFVSDFLNIISNWRCQYLSIVVSFLVDMFNQKAPFLT